MPSEIDIGGLSLLLIVIAVVIWLRFEYLAINRSAKTLLRSLAEGTIESISVENVWYKPLFSEPGPSNSRFSPVAIRGGEISSIPSSLRTALSGEDAGKVVSRAAHLLEKKPIVGLSATIVEFNKDEREVQNRVTTYRIERKNEG